jgi:putative transposase
MPILLEQNGLFGDVVSKLKAHERFDLVAWVVLPDHFHMIIDPLENNLSNLVRKMKLSFSHQYRQQRNMYRGKLWQRRFWDHIIRDDNDLNKHIDYIHYNPVKHGLVSSTFEWKHSSFHEYADNGYYSRDWGVVEPVTTAGEFGE